MKSAIITLVAVLAACTTASPIDIGRRDADSVNYFHGNQKIAAPSIILGKRQHMIDPPEKRQRMIDPPEKRQHMIEPPTGPADGY
jgi:hypothetical protein